MTEINRDAIVAQLDRLLAERDALREERDALRTKLEAREANAETSTEAEVEHEHVWRRHQNVTTSGYALPPYEACVECGVARQVDEEAVPVRNKRDGLYPKFRVERLRPSSRGLDHDDCDYFVLDMKHDPHAIPALITYANACEADLPQLARDLRERFACGIDE